MFLNVTLLINCHSFGDQREKLTLAFDNAHTCGIAKKLALTLISLPSLPPPSGRSAISVSVSVITCVFYDGCDEWCLVCWLSCFHQRYA